MLPVDTITLIIVMMAAILATVLAAVVILHPHIHEGPVIKLGLILVSLGGMGLALHVTHITDHLDMDDMAMIRSMAACIVGVLVVLLGAWQRVRHSPGLQDIARRTTGYSPLMHDEPCPADAQDHHASK